MPRPAKRASLVLPSVIGSWLSRCSQLVHLLLVPPVLGVLADHSSRQSADPPPRIKSLDYQLIPSPCWRFDGGDMCPGGSVGVGCRIGSRWGVDGIGERNCAWG